MYFDNVFVKETLTCCFFLYTNLYDFHTPLLNVQSERLKLPFRVREVLVSILDLLSWPMFCGFLSLLGGNTGTMS
jgi:hypothetical protein